MERPSLASMRQLLEARNSKDDWTGLKDAAQRRKIQNRLNVRAHRRRKAAQCQARLEGGADYRINRQHESPTSDLLSIHGNQEEPWLIASCRPVSYWDKIDVLPLVNPLPNYKRLMTVVRYNVVRAVATNMSILSIRDLKVRENCTLVRGSIELFSTPATFPESLMPTPLQKSTPHALWIDLIPSPAMRDNLIRLSGTFSVDDFLDQAGNGLHDGDGDGCTEMPGILVWADPWHPRGWELTEDFVKKWRYLLDGCQDMIEATNFWRAIRNERPLVMEV